MNLLKLCRAQGQPTATEPLPVPALRSEAFTGHPSPPPPFPCLCGDFVSEQKRGAGEEESVPLTAAFTRSLQLYCTFQGAASLWGLLPLLMVTAPHPPTLSFPKIPLPSVSERRLCKKRVPVAQPLVSSLASQLL